MQFDLHILFQISGKKPKLQISDCITQVFYIHGFKEKPLISIPWNSNSNQARMWHKVIPFKVDPGWTWAFRHISRFECVWQKGAILAVEQSEPGRWYHGVAFQPGRKMRQLHIRCLSRVARHSDYSGDVTFCRYLRGRLGLLVLQHLHGVAWVWIQNLPLSNRGGHCQRAAVEVRAKGLVPRWRCGVPSSAHLHDGSNRQTSEN